jgi:hypothetical protein
MHKIIARPWRHVLITDSSNAKLITNAPKKTVYMRDVYCPLHSVGYLFFTFGQKFNRMVYQCK